MPQKKEIYFHVGLPKTASTFLQQKIFPRFKGVHFTRKRYTDKYPEIVVNTDHNKFLFSCEYADNLEVKLDLLEQRFPQAKVILVLRKHTGWISSKYKYHIRKHGSHDFRSFFDIYEDKGVLKQSDVVYENFIRMIDSRFTNKPLILFQHELKENPKQFIQRIADYMEVEPPEKLPASKVNSSFSNRQLRVLLWLNRTYPYRLHKYPRGSFSRKLYYRYRQYLLHTVAFFANFMPWISKEKLIPEDDLYSIKNKYKADWKACLEYASELEEAAYV